MAFAFGGEVWLIEVVEVGMLVVEVVGLLFSAMTATPAATMRSAITITAATPCMPASIFWCMGHGSGGREIKIQAKERVFW